MGEPVLTPREHRLAAALYKAMRYHDESSERTMAWSLRALRFQRVMIEAVELLDRGRTRQARDLMCAAIVEEASDGRGD